MSKDDVNPLTVLATIATVGLFLIAFAQYSEAPKLQAQRKAERVDDRVSQQLPVLAVEHCCNQVPLKRVDGAWQITTMPAEGDTRGIPETTIARREKAFVVEISNGGIGTAFDTEVRWEINGPIQLRNGNAVYPTKVNGGMRPFTWPKILHPHETAFVRNLPEFFYHDQAGQILNCSGELVIICKDSQGNEHSFREPFTVEAYYDANTKWGQRLSFHFDSRPHSVAMPDWGASGFPN